MEVDLTSTECALIRTVLRQADWSFTPKGRQVASDLKKKIQAGVEEYDKEKRAASPKEEQRT